MNFKKIIQSQLDRAGVSFTEEDKKKVLEKIRNKRVAIKDNSHKKRKSSS